MLEKSGLVQQFEWTINKIAKVTFFLIFPYTNKTVMLIKGKLFKV